MDPSLHPVPDPTAWRDRLVDRVTPRQQRWLTGPAEARRLAEEAVDQRLPDSEVWLVRDGEREEGAVWTGVDHGDLVVYDVLATDPADVGLVRDLVLAEARTRGLRGVWASSAPDDPVRVVFTGDPAFRLASTQMLLGLSEPPPASTAALTAMTDAEFAVFLDGEVESYAQERHAAGEPWETALDVSRTQLAELLPDGLASPEQHLFTVRADGEPVGRLWLSTSRPAVFVYDVEIDEAHRGKGLGRAAMNAGAGWARDRGAPAIALNVFGHNRAARALYDALGYAVIEDHFRASFEEAEA